MARTRVVVSVAALIVCALTSLAGAQERPGLGLIRAQPEEYQRVPKAERPWAGESLPAAVDLNPTSPPPGNQGEQGSCVGWAVAYAMKTHQEALEERWGVRDGDGRPVLGHVFSPAFIYNQINGGNDNGAPFSKAFTLVKEQGACTWDQMPYDARDCTRQPTDAARAQARKYRIRRFRRLLEKVRTVDLLEMKTQLAAGIPIVIGVDVDDGFYHASSVGYTWRESEGASVGPHALVIIGYDDERSAYRVINSWGSWWGDGGYCWLDYTHAAKVIYDAYVAEDAANTSSGESLEVETPAIRAWNWTTSGDDGNRNTHLELEIGVLATPRTDESPTGSGVEAWLAFGPDADADARRAWEPLSTHPVTRFTSQSASYHGVPLKPDYEPDRAAWRLGGKPDETAYVVTLSSKRSGDAFVFVRAGGVLYRTRVWGAPTENDPTPDSRLYLPRGQKHPRYRFGEGAEGGGLAGRVEWVTMEKLPAK